MSELTAALATIKKCREITNCPSGVDLQDWVKRLAAENVGLRNSSSHVLQSGEPPKTYREEWFIARVKGRGFAVLRSLPEEYSYDYTTLDATYFRKDLILEWMQLPNSEFLPNVKTPATDRIVAGFKADGVAEREKTITFTAAKKRTQDGVALIAIGKPYKIHNDDVIGEFFIGERGRYGVITMDRLNYFATSDEYAWAFSLREGAK